MFCLLPPLLLFHHRIFLLVIPQTYNLTHKQTQTVGESPLQTGSHFKQPLLCCVTFSWSWQQAWGLWRARLSSGFLYCCYSAAYSKNNTLLLPQPVDLIITPKHSKKGLWMSHNKWKRSEIKPISPGLTLAWCVCLCMCVCVNCSVAVSH